MIDRQNVLILTKSSINDQKRQEGEIKYQLAERESPLLSQGNKTGAIENSTHNWSRDLLDDAGTSIIQGLVGTTAIPKSSPRSGKVEKVAV